MGVFLSTLSPTISVHAATKVDVKTTNYTLIVGLNKTLRFDFVPGTVAVGSAKIADFKVFRAKKEIHLIPKSRGITNLTIRDTNGDVREEVTLNVTISNLAETANDLQNLLKGIEGIDIKIVADKIFIDGEFLLPQDFNRVIAVVNEYDSKEIGIIAALSPIAQKIISEKMQEDLIRSLGGENEVTVSVRPLNHQFIIEGMVPSDELKLRATKIAESYVPDIFSEYGEREKVIKRIKPPSVLNLLTVNPPAKPEPVPPPPPPPPRIIKVTSYYVELSKNFNKNFNFSWAPGLSDGGGVGFEVGPDQSGIFTKLTGSIRNLLPRLTREKGLGNARVLQTHTLLISEKQEGKIENVTKIPFPVVTKDGTGTEFVDVGLVTTINPQISEGDPNSIILKVNFQFNTFQGPGEGGRPITQNKTVTTSLVIKNGESAAIGGLFGDQLSMSYNRLPSNVKSSSDPIFNLLRSRDFKHDKGQFAIFIAPEIVENAQQATEPLKKKFQVDASQ